MIPVGEVFYVMSIRDEEYQRLVNVFYVTATGSLSIVDDVSHCFMIVGLYTRVLCVLGGWGEGLFVNE